MTTILLSYWKVFRLGFLIFSLFLLGDVFYRWDGFKYYASFSEFLPSVALVTIIWSIIAGIVTFILWLPMRLFEWTCNTIGFKVSLEHLLLHLAICILFVGLAQTAKRVFFPEFFITLQIKLIIILCLALLSAYVAWLFRNKAIWFNIVNERITPLIWLFGIVFLLSVPVVVYTTWFSKLERLMPVVLPWSSEDNTKQQNIILITFDTLTALDMSTYGYQRETTPFISEWSKDAFIFTRTEAASNHTTPTIASLMTGKRGWTHQVYQQKSPIVKFRYENMAFQLLKNGYRTMAYFENSDVASPDVLGISDSFSSVTNFSPVREHFLSPLNSVFHRFFHGKFRIYNWILLDDFFPMMVAEDYIYRYFKKYFKEVEVPESPYVESGGTEGFDRFISDIDKEKPEEPYFAWIHVFPPHHPYLPPSPFKGMFDPTEKMRTWVEQKQGKRQIRQHRFPMEMQQTIDRLRAFYDEFIRYCDYRFQHIIAELETRGMLQNTIIVLTADHGESFEHNFYGHAGPFLFEQVTHIPLIIKVSGQRDGHIINDLVEQIDIPATILDLAGIENPSWMEGRSLLPLMQGHKLPSKPALSMYLDKNPARGYELKYGLIAVWDGDYKLIYDIEKEKSLLFNLRQDPGELYNLFDKELERGQHLLSLIKENLKRANERISMQDKTP